MKYKFNNQEEIGKFIEFCEENGIPHEFDRVQKWVRIDDSYKNDADYFIENNL